VTSLVPPVSFPMLNLAGVSLAFIAGGQLVVCVCYAGQDAARDDVGSAGDRGGASGARHDTAGGISDPQP